MQDHTRSDHYGVADVLDDAADYIEKHGLNQDSFYARKGASPAEAREDGLPVCTIGGVAMALKTNSWWDGVIHLARYALEAHVGKYVPTWNDESDPQEVLDTIRLVAKEQRVLGDGA